MVVCRKGGLHAFASAQGRGRFVVCLLGLLVGFGASPAIFAGAHLTQFSVDPVPPPAPTPQPAPQQPAHGNTSLAATLTGTVPTHDATVGTLAGQASTQGGAAAYTIPIVVPPGRAGMQPDLSLNYNSRGGNSAMGPGWSISGSSSIHRCPRTPEQDAQTLGVMYSSTDRLCLDGERLVLASTSTKGYGIAGAEYRTEVDSYARIYQVGSDIGTSASATCFRVEQKNGRILHYGGVVSGTAPSLTCATTTTVHSSVQPTGAKTPDTKPATLSWMVEKIQDRVGNNQFYTYTNTPNGENLLLKVTYTGKDAAAGDRAVIFTYQTRTAAASTASDIASSFLAGGLTMQTQALKCITTSIGTVNTLDPCDKTKFIRTYLPTYTTLAYSRRLAMNGMQECATNTSGAACHPPTTFTYNDGPLTYPLTSLAGIGLPGGAVPDPVAGYNGNPNTVATIGDLDGDGTRESIATIIEADGAHTFLVQMTGDRVVQGKVDLTNTAFSKAGEFKDIDGDGRAEMIEVPQSSSDDQHLALGVWKLGRGVAASTVVTGSSTPQQNAAALWQTVPTNIAYPVSGLGVYTGDFNGDGRLDIAVISTTATADCSSGRGVILYLNAMTGVASSWSQALFDPAVGTRSAPKPSFCLNYSSSGVASSVQTIDHIADFDGDGLPDFFLRTDTANGSAKSTHLDGVVLTHSTGSAVSTTTLTCSGMGFVDDATPLSNTDDCHTGSQAIVAQWIDINGDGLDDFVIARVTQGTWNIRLNQGGKMGPEINTGSTEGLDTTATGNFRYAGRLPTMDVDGDGKPDFLTVSRTQGMNGFAVKMCTIWKVDAINSADQAVCPSGNASALSQLSGTSSVPPNSCPAYACPEDPGSNTVSLPANADASEQPSFPYAWNGTPAFGAYTTTHASSDGFDNSIYHLAQLKFVQTGPAAFSVVRIETPLTSRLSNVTGTTAASDDLFGDGLPDLLTTIGCTNQQVSFPNYFNPGAPPQVFNQCAVIGDGTYGPATLFDGPNGTAGTATSTFATQAVLYANVNQGVTGPGGSLPPAAPALAQREEVSGVTSLGGLPLPHLPGLLDGWVNGLGDSGSWGYRTLSMKDTNDGVPLYTVPSSNGYVDSRHYYFSSSMPVVYGMLQSPAVGTDYGGFRSAHYGYAQAMYNHFGRGFQGFYQTTSKEYAGPTGDTARAVETITTFNQKFPIAGKVACVHTLVPGTSVASSLQCLGATTPVTGTIVQGETDTWGCDRSHRTTACAMGDTLSVPTSNTAVQPFLDTQTVQNFDLASGGLSSEVDTVNANDANTSGWDNYNCGSGGPTVYGNLNNQVVTSSDKAKGGVFVTSHTVKTTACYNTGDTTNWWINKLNSHSVTSGIVYASGHLLPATASAPDQTVGAVYTWNTDHTLQAKAVQSFVADEQSTTTYCYPQASATTTPACPQTTLTTTSYGLPTQISVTAPDLPALLSPTRTTSFAYSKDGTTAAGDGYFVYQTTNGLLQTITTAVETNDGQVTAATDPNSVKTSTTYDPFGRATNIAPTGSDGAAFASPVQIAYTNCANAGCAGYVGEDDNEVNAAYRVTTTQAGAPTQVAWMDALGRPVKHAHAGFDGTYIASFTDYEDMGTVLDRSTPYFVGVTSNFDCHTNLSCFAYDALNRPTITTAPATEFDPVHGDRETDTRYIGRQTTTTVHATSVAPNGSGVCPTPASNLCLQTTRSTNVLGQLMQTSESPGGVAQTTNYWTEAQGHVVAMQDVEGNLTTAKYNELGQRTTSNDPDQGQWTFDYDAFGELLDQTDARGVTTTMTVRDALGRLTQRQQVPPVSPLPGTDPNLVIDTWSYDPAHGIGELGTVARYRGTSRTAPLTTNNPQVWQEQTTYQATTARPIGITTTINEGGSVTLLSAMDYDGDGRPNTHTYPGGLVVKNNYTANGQLSGLSNNATNYTYWTATAANEWDHVTGETLPGNVTGTHQDYHSTGQAYRLSWSGTATSDTFTYGYDSFDNLVSQQRSAPGANNTESYTYDPLQRLTKAARTGGTVNYAYTLSGNLKYKDDYSTNTGTNPVAAYVYASVNGKTGNCGPHAANTVQLAGGGSATYVCDPNGNVVGGNTLNNTLYDAGNHPTQITRTFLGNGVGDKIFCNGFDGSVNTCPNAAGGGMANWAYDSNGQRDYEYSLLQGSRYYGPAGYEFANGVHKIELGPVIVSRTGTNDTITVVLKDRLGSTLDTIDGTTFTRRHFDAFGKARNGDMSDRPNGTLNLTPDTIHGFTDHTHEDDIALIHMHGRMFDPNLGRFLNVDPVIGGTGSQALNPYSYLVNNPFGGTDPSGYDGACLGSLIDRHDGGSCSDQGVQNGGENSPSKEQKAKIASEHLSQVISDDIVDRFNGKDKGTTAKGAASTPNNAQDGIAQTGGSVGTQPPTIQLLQTVSAWSVFKSHLSDAYSETNAFFDFFNSGTRESAEVWDDLKEQHAIRRSHEQNTHPVSSLVGTTLAQVLMAAPMPEEAALEETALAESAIVLPEIEVRAIRGPGPGGGESTAAAYGRDIHSTFDYGPGYEREFRFKSGRRVDAINFQKREILELKPNNRREIRRGMRQLEKYRKDAEKELGGKWTTRIVTYERP